MSVLSGRAPFSVLVPFLLVGCTTEPVPGESPDATSSESSETIVPTTGLDQTGFTDSGDDSTETGDESTETGDESTDNSGESPSTGGEPEETDASSSTGAPRPICGDAVLDAGEECDDGFAANTLTGACLPDCTAASCGDGFVHAGNEDCDLGVGNSFDYGGCNELTCKWGPRCGDGQIDAPHEVCDPGNPNGQGDGVAVCDNDCRFEGRVVFLSSETYDGNLGGLAGADKQCRDLAASFDAARADSYRAWLSDGEASPQTRFSHGPEFDGVPYVLRSGVEIAADFTDLVTHGPWPAIDLTEKGEVLTLERVWTNTGVDGHRLTETDHCDGWTGDLSQVGRYGRNAMPLMSPDLDEWKTFGQWTTAGSTSCFKQHRLYCFEN